MTITAPVAPEKIAPPPLSARAPRPHAVRLRGTAVKIVVGAAALTLSGALVYGQILAPKARAYAQDRAREKAAAAARAPGDVRPNERITTQPDSYDKLGLGQSADTLGEPRTAPVSSATTQPSATASETTTDVARAAPVSAGQSASVPVRQTDGRVDVARQARGSGLFFSSEPQRSENSAVRSVTHEAGRVSIADSGPVRVSSGADYEASYGHHALIAPLSPYELKAGTMIPAALLTSVDTGRPGPVVAITTEAVFDSVSGQILLVPQGSRLIGAQAGDSSYGEKRAFLVWKRLILPNGKSLLLDDQAGTDSSGTTGVPGHADRRLLQLGGAVLLSGAISTLGQFARGHDNTASRSLVGDVGDATAIQAVQVGGRLMDRELNVQPKIAVRAGSPVQVLLTKDLILEPAQR